MKNDKKLSPFGIRENVPITDLTAAAHEKVIALVEYCSFAAYEKAVHPVWLAALQKEATTLYPNSMFAEQQDTLSYSANVISLGPVASQFLNHSIVRKLLTTYFGGVYKLSEEISCLTFYDSSDYLGPHVDKPADRCSVTIIIYLFAKSPNPSSNDTGLLLNVYGEEHSSLDIPKLQIPTTIGTVVLGKGSKIWHERPCLKNGESVTAITGCYHLLS